MSAYLRSARSSVRKADEQAREVRAMSSEAGSGDQGRRLPGQPLQADQARLPVGAVAEPFPGLLDPLRSHKNACVQAVRADGDADRRADLLSRTTADASTRERSQAGRSTMKQSRRSSCTLLAALPSAVGRARDYTRWVLDAWRLSAMADTVELLVSELVTNAVRATGILDESGDESLLVGKVNPVYVCLSLAAETLLIQVWDISSAPPQRRMALEDDETGRGLLLVQTLSKEWGCEVLEAGGKIVWCRCLIAETA